jgi:hypothetical protein
MIREVQERANRKNHTSGCSASKYHDEIPLYIPLHSPGDFFEVGNSLIEMSKAYRRLENGETKIQFLCTNNVDCPLDFVIPESLVPFMERLRGQKVWRISHSPVSKEGESDTIQAMLLHSSEILLYIIGINCDVTELLQCALLGAWGVSFWITELLIHSSSNGGRLSSHTSEHAGFGSIHNVQGKRCIATSQVAKGIVHHNANTSGDLERSQHNVEALMDEPIGKDTLNVFGFVDEFRDQEQRSEEESIR